MNANGERMDERQKKETFAVERQEHFTKIFYQNSTC